MTEEKEDLRGQAGGPKESADACLYYNVKAYTEAILRVCPGLLPQHIERMRRSGISPDVVKARGYKSMGGRHDRDDLAAMGFTKAPIRIPGLLEMLHGADGELRGHKYRPDDPRLDKDGKPIKYETPKGQSNFLDVPPTVRDALHKGKQAIFITEGTRKADALASLGCPVVNVGGVYNWRGRNADDGFTVLADWECISIRGNVFILAFDSDIITKREVYDALVRLKRWLEFKGAKVRVMVLPPLLLSGKTGVDDFIFERGITDWHDLAPLVVDDLPSLNGHHQEAGPAIDPKDLPPLSELLDAVAGHIRRFVVLDNYQASAVTLWVAHAHAFGAAETTPYVSVRSAEKRSGKSRLLEVMELLVPHPLKTENISVAALAHSVNQGDTLLLDEVDSVFGKGKGSETQEMLRGVLDGGYRRGGAYVRMVGQGASMTPKRFNTFSPKILSGIGKLPGTLEDRCAIVTLKRKLPSERVERFRYRDASEQAKPTREQLQTWAASAIDKLRDARPEIPGGLDDRAADAWEPLLAIADLAGGDWPERARDAARALSAGEVREDGSLGVRLLADIMAVFGDNDRIRSKKLVDLLVEMDEAPWGSLWDNKSLDTRKLARLLGPYNIASTQMKFDDGKGGKGYSKASFEDAWQRYLPIPPTDERNSETFESTKPSNGQNTSETEASGSASGFGYEIPPEAVYDGESFGVSDKKGGVGETDGCRADCTRCLAKHKQGFHKPCAEHKDVPTYVGRGSEQ